MSELVLGNSEAQTNAAEVTKGHAWGVLAEAKKNARLESIRFSLATAAQTATSIQVALLSNWKGGRFGPSTLSPGFVISEGSTTEHIESGGKPEVKLPSTVELLNGHSYFMIVMPLGGTINISHGKAVGSKIYLSLSTERLKISEFVEWESITKEGPSPFEGLGFVPTGTLREKFISDSPAGQSQVLATLSAEATAGATTWTTSAAAPVGLQGGAFRAVVGIPNAKGEVENGEYVRVTKATTTTWTVEPGTDGSTTVAHNAGQSIYHVLTAGSLENTAASGTAVNINVCKGVDPTGATDSSLGLKEAAFQARKEGKNLVGGAGTFKVAEGPIDISECGFWGAGPDKTKFVKNSTNGEFFYSQEGPLTFGNCTLENENKAATTGGALKVEKHVPEVEAEQAFTMALTMDNFIIRAPWNGVELINVGGPVLRNFVIENIVNNGLAVKGNITEIRADNFVLAANEIKTHKNETTAVLLNLNAVEQGALTNSSHVFENAEILLGQRSMVTNGGSYFWFSNVFFDSSREGVQLKNSNHCRFTQCWFACHPAGVGNGLELKEAGGANIMGCEIFECGKAGIFVDNKCTGILIQGNTLAGMASTNSSIEVEAGTKEFSIQNNQFGAFVGAATSHIKVGEGGSERFLIANNLFSAKPKMFICKTTGKTLTELETEVGEAGPLAYVKNNIGGEKGERN